MEKVENMGMPMPEDYMERFKGNLKGLIEIEFLGDEHYRVTSRNDEAAEAQDLFSSDELNAFIRGIDAALKFDFKPVHKDVIDIEAWNEAYEKWAQKQIAKK